MCTVRSIFIYKVSCIGIAFKLHIKLSTFGTLYCFTAVIIMQFCKGGFPPRFCLYCVCRFTMHKMVLVYFATTLYYFISRHTLVCRVVFIWRETFLYVTIFMRQENNFWATFDVLLTIWISCKTLKALYDKGKNS